VIQCCNEYGIELTTLVVICTEVKLSDTML